MGEKKLDMFETVCLSFPPPMRLRSLRLQSFRGFDDATLDLGRPLTVLFGVNGSGKSSALAGIVQVLREIPAPLLGGYPLWGHVPPSDEDIRLGADNAWLTLELSGTFSGVVGQYTERCSIQRGWRSLADRPTNTEAFGPRYDLLPVFYGPDRSIAHAPEVFDPSNGKAEPPDGESPILSDSLSSGHAGFRSFFRWFKEREDAENRRKVQERDLSATDPQLSAVRRAVEGLLPGFGDLRIQHDPLRQEVRKSGAVLSINQLSDGEKIVLTMTADIARRLAMAYPDHADPLSREAIVLIDEVELHLHPRWQRHVLPAWRRIFPGSQLIVTTHSPQVLSEVPADAVVLIEDFQFVRPAAPTAGRDTNSLLEEVMDTPERPQPFKDRLAEVSRLIDEGCGAEAEAKLDAVAAELTDQDHEVVRLRTMLHFLGGPRAADPQRQ